MEPKASASPRYHGCFRNKSDERLRVYGNGNQKQEVRNGSANGASAL